MKKIVFAVLLTVVFSAVKSQDLSTKSPDSSTNKKEAVDSMVTVTNADYDMGRISAGKPLEYTVTIKNITKDTVVLQDVRVGCGCTTPKFRAGEKIAPGKTTFVVLGFNGDAHGVFTKTADIIFGNGLVKQVKFRGVTQDISPASNNF